MAQKVVFVIGHYLPGYRAGGPVRSLANLVESFGDEIEAIILTEDRDFGSSTPYPGVTSGRWYPVGKAQVMYLSPSQMTLRPWAGLLGQIDYDRVYLSSFFGAQTRRTLLLRRLGLIADRPVVLAPRGEFSPGALGLKRVKKRSYLEIALRLGLYDRLVWHATSAVERAHILQTVESFIPDLSSRLVVASNLISPNLNGPMSDRESLKTPGSARIVFLSRISRKKNLEFALASLYGLDEPVTFDIFGPIEDDRYWAECQRIISGLPRNIRVSYGGAVEPAGVARLLTGYHLFYLPTKGENFGHAIVEALRVGCLPLISDQTPWRGLEVKGVGWDIPLTALGRFKQALRRVAAMDNAEFTKWSTKAKHFGAELLEQQTTVDLPAYRQLFGTAGRG